MATVNQMNSEAPIDDTARSFLTFAEALIAKIHEWEDDAGPPLFEDIEVRFTENGRRGDIVKKLDYERLFRRRWDPSIAELGALARECIRLHLAGGIIKPPRLTDSEGKPIVAPSLDEILPSLVWAVARPVLVTLDNLQKLDVVESELLATYRKFAEGWQMEDVPQVATVPILNLVSASNIRISPNLELVPFTPANKNVLFSRTAIFSGYRDADQFAAFKLAAQFSNDTRKPVHFGTVAYETRLAIIAMRLLKAGDVGAQMLYYRSSLEHEEFTGGSGLPFRVREFTQDMYQLGAEETAPLLGLLASLRGASQHLDVGLGRFNQSYSRQTGEDRIIDLTIALESLLLADIKDELKYRLALRGAALLQKHRDPREVNALLLALYDVRSAIVHDGKHLYELDRIFKTLGTSLPGVQPKDLPSLCEELTRQVLKEYVARLLTGVTTKGINKALDSDIVGSLATVAAAPK